MALSSPYTRAIPSPTERTVPISATSIDFSYPASCRFRISVISSALISTCPLRVLVENCDRPSASAGCFPMKQLDGPHRGAIEDLAPYACDESGEDRRIDPNVHSYPASEVPGECILDSLTLLVSDGRGDGNRCLDDPELAVARLPDRRQNLLERQPPAVLQDDREEASAELLDADAPRQVLQGAPLRFDRHGGRREKIPQAVIVRGRPRESRRALEKPLHVEAGRQCVEERPCVGAREPAHRVSASGRCSVRRETPSSRSRRRSPSVICAASISRAAPLVRSAATRRRSCFAAARR